MAGSGLAERRGARWDATLRDRLIADGAVLLAIGAWWWTARGLPAYVLPGPVDVAAALLRFATRADYALHAAITMARVVGAVTVAMLAAVGLAVLVRTAPVLGQAIERRLLTLLNSFPAVGWAILGLIWFGASPGTVLFIQVAIVLPFCLINALEGFRSLDAELEEMGRSMTRSAPRRFLRLTLPLVAPFLVAGLRVAYGIAWKVALVSELFGATAGLGYLLMQAQSNSDAATVFAACLVIVLLSAAFDAALLRPLARRFSRNQAR